MVTWESNWICLWNKINFISLLNIVAYVEIASKRLYIFRSIFTFSIPASDGDERRLLRTFFLEGDGRRKGCG
jgi:hypothetical protein